MLSASALRTGGAQCGCLAASAPRPASAPPTAAARLGRAGLPAAPPLPRTRARDLIVCMAHPRRVARVAKQLEREIGMLLLTDPVLRAAVAPPSEEEDGGPDPSAPLPALASVSGVDLSSNLQLARVHVSVYADAPGVTAAMARLARLESYVRRRVAGAMRLRLAPEIRFMRDDAAADAARLDAALARAAAVAAGTAEPPPITPSARFARPAVSRPGYAYVQDGPSVPEEGPSAYPFPSAAARRAAAAPRPAVGDDDDDDDEDDEDGDGRRGALARAARRAARRAAAAAAAAASASSGSDEGGGVDGEEDEDDGFFDLAASSAAAAAAAGAGGSSPRRPRAPSAATASAAAGSAADTSFFGFEAPPPGGWWPAEADGWGGGSGGGSREGSSGSDGEAPSLPPPSQDLGDGMVGPDGFIVLRPGVGEGSGFGGGGGGGGGGRTRQRRRK